MNTRTSIIKSRKLAIVISYIMLFANTLSNLLLTPLYLKYLGLETYGLYQMIYSVAHYVLILDFGINTTMVRYISLYREKKDKQAEENFAIHCLGIVFVTISVVYILGYLIDYNLLKIYPTIAQNEIGLAHKIFWVMIGTIIFSIIEKYFQGIVMAYEHFTIANCVSLGKVVLKTIAIILMLVQGVGVLAISSADLVVVILAVIFLFWYSIFGLKFKIRFHFFNKKLLIAVLTFMLALLLQSVVTYINNVADKTILGIMTTKTDVAIYSVAMTFITLFNSLPTVISSVFLPQATKLVCNNSTRDELTEFVIRPGRYQFMMCGAIIAGFLLFGREFIELWAGKNTLLAWNVALIIMIPNMIPLIENVVISILDAKNKRMFRSITLLMISIIHVLISIVLVSKYGMLGAPVGTAIAYIIGYGIVMNIYYSRVIGIKVIHMFKTVLSKVWICIIITSMLCIPLNFAMQKVSWITLIIKVVVFMVIYIVTLFVYGLRWHEKEEIMSVVNKILLKNIKY